MDKFAAACPPSLEQQSPDPRTGFMACDLPMDVSSSNETRERLLQSRDYDVDSRTGFMACHPPPARLPAEWELWENAFTAATDGKLQVGDQLGISEQAKACSKVWRDTIREVSSVKHLNQRFNRFDTTRYLISYLFSRPLVSYTQRLTCVEHILYSLGCFMSIPRHYHPTPTFVFLVRSPYHFSKSPPN